MWPSARSERDCTAVDIESVPEPGDALFAGFRPARQCERQLEPKKRAVVRLARCGRQVQARPAGAAIRSGNRPALSPPIRRRPSGIPASIAVDRWLSRQLPGRALSGAAPAQPVPEPAASGPGHTPFRAPEVNDATAVSRIPARDGGSQPEGRGPGQNFHGLSRDSIASRNRSTAALRPPSAQSSHHLRSGRISRV